MLVHDNIKVPIHRNTVLTNNCVLPLLPLLYRERQVIKKVKLMTWFSGWSLWMSGLVGPPVRSRNCQQLLDGFAWMYLRHLWWAEVKLLWLWWSTDLSSGNSKCTWKALTLIVTLWLSIQRLSYSHCKWRQCFYTVSQLFLELGLILTHLYVTLDKSICHMNESRM